MEICCLQSEEPYRRGFTLGLKPSVDMSTTWPSKGTNVILKPFFSKFWFDILTNPILLTKGKIYHNLTFFTFTVFNLQNLIVLCY